VQLHRAHERFSAAGAELTLIGQATPRHAASFHRRLGLDGVRLLADERRRSYKAAGLKVGTLADLVGPRSAVAGVRHLARSRVFQGRPVGNVAQLGGAMVVRPDGAVALSHVSEHAGDSVSVGALLAAVGAAP
jgi:hypothetical protein